MTQPLFIIRVIPVQNALRIAAEPMRDPPDKIHRQTAPFACMTDTLFLFRELMLVDQGGQLHTAVNVGFEVDPLGVRFHGLNGNKQDPRNKGISPALIKLGRLQVKYSACAECEIISLRKL